VEPQEGVDDDKDGGGNGVFFQFACDSFVNVEAIHGLLTKFFDVIRSTSRGWGCIDSFRIDTEQVESLNSLVNDRLVEEEIAEVMRSAFGIIPMGAAAGGGGSINSEDEMSDEGSDAVGEYMGGKKLGIKPFISQQYESRFSAAITGTSTSSYGRPIQTLSHSRLVDAKEMLKEQLRQDKVEAKTVCSVCGSGEASVHGNWILLCDRRGCGGGCHMHCMTPKLRNVPEEDWYCTQCSESKLEG
jgi:hypothetical protein